MAPRGQNRKKFGPLWAVTGVISRIGAALDTAGIQRKGRLYFLYAPHPQHKVYPYLLRGVAITRPNQVWGTDITYIRVARGFCYLVAIMDWYSRKVLSWRISNTMEANFCVDCLEEALQRYPTPEIFNSDQGAQFTAEEFTGVLKREGVTISMDGRGRAFDNIFVERLWRTVKYEDIYLKGYADVSEVTFGLAEYFPFYNEERPHMALANETPTTAYRTGQGGGALIVDKYGPAATTLGKPAITGQRCSAASEAKATPQTGANSVLTIGSTLIFWIAGHRKQPGHRLRFHEQSGRPDSRRAGFCPLSTPARPAL